MRVSYRLLKEYVALSHDPEELARLLTEHAFEVEGVTRAGVFERVVAARVLTVSKHPNADRLSVVKLDAGDRTVEPVVCGATNFKVDDMVALALPGATIERNIHSQNHERYELKRAVIRGVESQGMICAAFELGLAEEPGEGVMVLDPTTLPGTPLADLYGSGEVALTVSLPANRPDLYSHLGIAREISAITGAKFLEPKALTRRPAKAARLPVAIRDKRLCPRYAAVRLGGATVRQSPEFIQRTLRACGMRPVNNVVDITNYVMIELGQPTHAFDAAHVSGGIVVRRAVPGEQLTALNHRRYELDAGTLVIADHEKALALAGIMGGQDSEITERTTEVILEVANFEPKNIRRTARALNLRSESAAIWEKGVHPRLIDLGLSRALELLERYAGAKTLAVGTAGAVPKAQRVIRFSAAEINALLGTDLPTGTIKKLLGRYGIRTSGSKSLRATVPWWRSDVREPADLAEEVLKLHGYNHVEPKALQLPPQIGEPQPPLFEFKFAWARMGYREVQNYSFISEQDIAKLNLDPEDFLKVLNPLSQEQGYLKDRPLAPLLKNVELNQKRHTSFKLFELTRRYERFEHEPLVLAAVTFDREGDPHRSVAELKADCAEFLKSFGLSSPAYARKGGALEVSCDGEVLGTLSVVPETVRKNFGVEGTVGLLELELERTTKFLRAPTYRPVNHYPGIRRDISVVVSEDLPWADIETLVRPIHPLISSVDLFEAAYLATDQSSLAYHRKLRQEGKKNLGIRVIFRASDRTLQEGEITGIYEQIVLKLKQELGCEIR